MQSASTKPVPERRPPVSLGSVAVVGVVLVGVLLFFAHLRLLDYIVLGLIVERIWIIQGIAYAVGLAFFWVRYDAFSDVYRVITRCSCAGVAAYLLFEPPVFTLVEGGRGDLLQFVDLNYWPALAFAGISVWRPSFAYAAATYVMLTRSLVEPISGYQLSVLDVRFMMEMAQFLAIGGICLVVVRRLLPNWSGFRARYLETQICIAFAAIGFHLGNYFWSAYAKIILDPWPWSWVLQNETEAGLLVALHKGVLPIAVPAWLLQFSYDSFGTIAPLSNALVLGFQLAAIVVILKVDWLRVATLAYDALHVGIYVLGGLFFWPWVWNNVSVLLALKNQSDASIGWAPKIVCMIVVLMGGLNEVGKSARLGWYDLRDFRSPILEVRANGSDTWVRVPLSFFMSHSYAMSHGYFGLREADGHYDPTVWASSVSRDRWQSSGQCPEPSGVGVETQEQVDARLDRLRRFLVAHHAKMVEREEDGALGFYLRSHHHPSNPFLHRDFSALNLSEVVEYRYLDTSLCLDISDGKLLERVRAQDVYVFEVTTP